MNGYASVKVPRRASNVLAKVEPMLLHFSQRTFSDGTWVTVSNWCGVRVRRCKPALIRRGWVEYESIGDTGSLLVERFSSSDFWGYVPPPVRLLPGDVVKVRQTWG